MSTENNQPSVDVKPAPDTVVSEKHREDVDQQQAFADSALEEEIALGGTPAGKATNLALRAIARTARSFLIYDSRNEAIRGFLQDLQTTIFSALQQYGEMNLEIRPFELLRGPEIVYLERDRERSLAFRLFRDGVRRIVIDPEVEWDEILRLLEILSIRFTGIRQQEDDVVTLLLKSGFKHIRVFAVEGFVPDDEEYCADDPSALAARRIRTQRRTESHVDVPLDWDLPVPTPLVPVELEYFDLEEKDLFALQEEGSSRYLPENTVRLLLEMLKVVNDPTDPTSSADVDGLVQEVRDFLLSEGQLSSVLELIHQVRDIVTNAEQRQEIISSFTSERALRKIISSLPKAVTEPPAELVQILEISPINHLPVLIDILNVERRSSSRSVLRGLLGYYIEEQASQVIASLAQFDTSVAVDLIDTLYSKDKKYGKEIIKNLQTSEESSLVHKSLTILHENSDWLPTFKEYLLELLQHTKIYGVRAKVLALLGKIADRELYPLLQNLLETSKDLTQDEAILIGENMAKSYPAKAKELFTEWLQSYKWYTLQRVHVQDIQRYAAIAGLSLVPGESCVEVILSYKEETSAVLAEFCTKRLVVRRQLGIQ